MPMLLWSKNRLELELGANFFDENSSITYSISFC